MITNIYDVRFPAINGGDIDMSAFRGKPILMVNTASACGFTEQYSALQSLYDQYRDQGLQIIAMPCNDFGSQEPGSEADIQQFCTGRFDVSFPMTAKLIANGPDAHPYFDWVASHLGSLSRPKWNFYKHLIGPDGLPVKWFSSLTKPDSPKVMKLLTPLLADASRQAG